MLEVRKLGPVLGPTENDFENFAVLNPGVWQDGNSVHLFYRAIDKNFKSCIGYARLNGPTEVAERWDKPIMRREYDYESKGVEDPDITKLGDTYYMTYVAHDGKNARTAYAVSKDLKNFEKKGIISAEISYHEAKKLFQKTRLKDAYTFFATYYEKQAGEDVMVWHKDFSFFPKKIGGKYALLHRILPDIQIAFFDNFKELSTKKFWRNHIKNLADYVVLENKHWFESRNMGGGCPPIETENGWLLIFHCVEEKNMGRIYHASAAILDKENPLKVIGRAHEPLFSPGREWEKRGLVSNVVFPTGTAQFGNAGNSHAWFEGFAPYDNPTVAIVVLIEGGGEGSSAAVPVAYDFFKEYFNLYYQN